MSSSKEDEGSKNLLITEPSMASAAMEVFNFVSKQPKLLQVKAISQPPPPHMTMTTAMTDETKKESKQQNKKIPPQVEPTEQAQQQRQPAAQELLPLPTSKLKSFQRSVLDSGND